MAVNGFLVDNEVQKYNYESLENYNTPDFSTSSIYQVGDYVMYQGKLYRCTTEITTSGGWDSSKWSLAILSDDVANLRSSVESGEYGLSELVKQAILQIARKVAYIDDQGQTYYDDLYDALYPLNVVSINATYTQSGTVYDTETLDSLKADLVVTAVYSDSSTATVAAYAYTLSGELTVGTSTITVSYGGKTTTFNVAVTGYPIISFYNGANPSYFSDIQKYGLTANNAYTNTRASAFLTEQYNSATIYYIYDNGARYPVPSYPLFIQDGATKITVDCPGLCCAINVHKDENDTATQIDGGSWSAVGGVIDYDLSTFIAEGATHLSIGFKNSTNTSLANTTIDSTTVAISFS